MAKFFSGEKIRNFWCSGFWQKIALLVGGAVLCFVLILILSAFFGKTKFGIGAAAVLFFGIIGFALAIIYQIVKAIKGKVRKTEASSPEIEKKKAKKTSPITRALGIVGAVLVIGLIGKSGISDQRPERKMTPRQEKIAEATAKRLQTIIDLNTAESPEFVSAEATGDMIVINYSRPPKILTVDAIARGQAVNLSRERGQATGSPEFAIVRVKVGNKIVASCRANNAKIVSCD